MSHRRGSRVVSNPILVVVLVCALFLLVDMLVFRGAAVEPVPSRTHVIWLHAWVIVLLLAFGVYAHVAMARHEAHLQRLAHLNAVLAAVRNVNQLITQERDRDQLLHRACECLTETRGYSSAWIALFDDDDKPTALYQSGLNESFDLLRAWLQEGNVPVCVARVLEEPGVVTISEPTVECPACPLAGKAPHEAILATRIEHAGKLYGLTVLSTDRRMLDDLEEQALAQELAGDLGLALAHIEADQARERAQQARDQQFQAQGLAADAMRALLEAPFEQFDATINATLGAAARFLGMDRAYVFLFSPDGSRMTNTHEWCAPGVEPQMDTIQNFPVDAMPWWSERIREGDHVAIPDVDSLSPEAAAEKKEFQRQGIRSLLSLPLRDETRMVGFFGFDAVNRHVEWTDEVIRLAEVIGGVLFSAVRSQEAERALRESEERYRRIVQTANEAIAITDQNLNITFANRKLAEMTGYALDEGLGKSSLEFMDEENAALVRHNWERMRREGESDRYELKLRRKDGSDLWVLNSAAPILDQDGCVTGSLVMLTDITERKRAEEALRAREQELAAILDSMVEAVMHLDADLRIVWANRAAERAAGVDPGGLTGRRCCEAMGEEGEECAVCPATLAWSTGEPRQGEVLMSDGRVWQMNACPVRDDAGAVAGVVKTMLDITERKQAEERIIRARDFYVTLIDEFPNPIWRAGTDANCNYFNKAWLEFTGRTLEEELGEGWAEGVHPDDVDRCVATYMGAFEAREPFFMEYRLRHHTGEYRWIVDYGRPMYDVDGRFAGYIGSCYDIQELRQAEESQRMAALGELAASIAHEFNNLLAIMSGRAQLAQLLGTSESHRELIEAVLRATSRAAKISRNLLGFARPSEPERGPLAIQDAIEAALLLAEREFTNAGIEVKREYHTAGALAYADTAQMEQVFLNLIINACHAMREGGTLTIATRHVAEEDGPGCIEVAVEDTGRGIRPEHLGRLFDPFFTTKGDDPTGGRPGTGLGLPVSRNIVLAHDGTLGVESEWGVGTTFTVRVPVWASDTVPAQPEGDDAGQLPQAEIPARVLVADDEETFCEVMGAALRQAGYEVVCAHTTAAALDAVRTDSFDVIVCDLLMPGGGGRALLEALQGPPDKPVFILVSGVLDQDRARELAAQGADFCLTKPLQLPTLLETVQMAVRSAQGGTAE